MRLYLTQDIWHKDEFHIMRLYLTQDIRHKGESHMHFLVHTSYTQLLERKKGFPVEFSADETKLSA